MAKTFHCTLVTPEEKVLDGPVTYASVPAWDGLVGVAPSRAPMLIKLGDGPLRLDFTEGGSRYFFLGGGFAQMKDNRLSLLSAEAVAAEDIVKGDAEKALDEAGKAEAGTIDGVERKQRQVARARQLMSMADKYGKRI